MSTVRPLSELLSKKQLRGLIVPGDVVDNNDPEKLMRVRVRVALLHREIQDSDIPWVRPLLTFAPFGLSGGSGAIKVPQIGSKVAIQFLDDTLYNAVYVGDVADSSTIPAELLSDYPNAYGWIDPAGNLFFVNTQTGVVQFVHISGSKLNISNNGDITVASAASVKVSGGNSVSVLGGNSVKIHAGSSVDIRASRIDLNKSTSGEAPESTTPRVRPTSKVVTDRVKK